MYADEVKNIIQIHKICETAEEKQLSMGDLRKKYIVHAFKKFVHTPPLSIINKETGYLIELSSRVIKEWRAKSRTRSQIIAIQLLDTMIEGARFLNTVKDYKNTPGIDDVSYFENNCVINTKIFKIKITVKRQRNRRFAYYYSVVNATP